MPVRPYARAAEHVIQHGYNPIPVVADSRLSYDKPIAFAWLAAPLVSLWGTIVGLKSASFVFTCAFVLAVWLFVRTYDPLRLCNRERSLALWLVCCNPLVVYQFWSAYPDTLFAALTLVAFSLTHIIATRTNQNTRKWIPVLALTVVAAILVRNYGLILLILV